ncbi:hypothetical protein P154DRAFT_522050 [Amniculicola lignicola CBS 123094]|uniref:Flavin reductase like domain-containing protein n=1 Tax=Amniculicola lignicola CBS 123094 TaxID=1392246 RepID=A0A6A5WJS9_9PLEO|nr:hypothetical protein P154DRAFT_522050 [Amniculicola lignicola CBS 123094]
MALRRRSAARFFSVFYRWSRAVDSSQLCSHTPHLRLNARSYHNHFRTSRAVHTPTYPTRSRLGSLKDDHSEEKAEDEIVGEAQERRLQDDIKQRGPEDALSTASGEEQHQHDLNQAADLDEIPTGGHYADLSHQVSRKASNVTHLRSVMRHVPYPVVLIMAPGHSKSAPMNGMAVSSFNTVSMDPPTVSFNVREPSTTLAAIRANKGFFTLTILAGRSSSAQLLDKFTLGNSPKALEQRAAIEIVRYKDIGFETGVKFVKPILHDPTDVFASLTGRIDQEVKVGDHVIVVAKVDDVQRLREAGSTLAYVQGKYVAFSDKPLFEHDTSVPPPPATAPPSSKLPTARPPVAAKNPEPKKESKIGYSPLYDRDPSDCGYFSRSHSTYDRPAPFHVIKRGDETREMYETVSEKDHRWLIAESVQKYIHSNSVSLFALNSSEAVSRIRADLNLPEGALGINISHLLYRMKHPEASEPPPYFNYYYGKLTPHVVRFIGERLRILMKDDPNTLKKDFRDVYSSLSVELVGTGLLTNDLMEILRQSDVIPAFQEQEVDMARPSISFETLEQIAHKLIAHLRTLDPEKAVLMRSTQLLCETFQIQFDVPNELRLYVDEVRARLHFEAFPQFFEDSSINIASIAHTAVPNIIYRRIWDFVFSNPSGTSAPLTMGDSDPSTLNKEFPIAQLLDIYSRLLLPTHEILRRCHVDPLIQGFDPNYLISFLRSKTKGADGLPLTLVQKKEEIEAAHFRRSKVIVRHFLELISRLMKSQSETNSVPFSKRDYMAAAGFTESETEKRLWVYLPPKGSKRDKPNVMMRNGVWLQENGDDEAAWSILLELAAARKSSWAGNFTIRDRVLLKRIFRLKGDEHRKAELEKMIKMASKRWDAEIAGEESGEPVEDEGEDENLGSMV